MFQLSLTYKVSYETCIARGNYKVSLGLQENFNTPNRIYSRIIIHTYTSDPLFKTILQGKKSRQSFSDQCRGLSKIILTNALLIYEYCLSDFNSKKSDFLFYKVAPSPTLKHTVEHLYNGHFGDTEESGHCRGGCCWEVETRVNVSTVRQKNGLCREVTISGGSTVLHYSHFFVCVRVCACVCCIINLSCILQEEYPIKLWKKNYHSRI